MNFLGGSLPNVMFIIGILAIGLGLGIELKLVPLNKEIDKTGRIGAMVLGAILVATSLYIYLNPSLANPSHASAIAASAAPSTPLAAPSAAPVAASIAAEPPAPSEPPAVAPTAAPSATPAPTATPLPTALPPTEIPRAAIPDLHGLSENEARDALGQAGLQARKGDTCSGADQGSKTKKHRIQCQNPAANEVVPLGTTVEYVLQ